MNETTCKVSNEFRFGTNLEDQVGGLDAENETLRTQLATSQAEIERLTKECENLRSWMDAHEKAAQHNACLACLAVDRERECNAATAALAEMTKTKDEACRMAQDDRIALLASEQSFRNAGRLLVAAIEGERRALAALKDFRELITECPHISMIAVNNHVHALAAEAREGRMREALKAISILPHSTFCSGWGPIAANEINESHCNCHVGLAKHSLSTAPAEEGR